MSIGSHELQLYVDNDHPLYTLTMNIAKNLATKKARGVYDRQKAHKAFLLHLAAPAAKKYVREFGGGPWNAAFTKQDRDDFAKTYVEWFEAEYKAGAFESVLPKKYQKKATRKKTSEALIKAGRNPIETKWCPRGMIVQTLLFDIGKYTRTEAARWARGHGYRATKVHLKGGHWRIRQKAPSTFRRGGFRTIPFGDSGIKAVVGCPRI